VGKAQRFERRLQGMVGDAFARVFGGNVVPQEVAQALQREADDNARPLAGGRVLAPNRYTVRLGATDYDRLAGDEQRVIRMLKGCIQSHLAEQAWDVYGDVVVALKRSGSLHTGQFRTSSAVDPDTPQPRTAGDRAMSQHQGEPAGDAQRGQYRYDAPDYGQPSDSSWEPRGSQYAQEQGSSPNYGSDGYDQPGGYQPAYGQAGYGYGNGRQLPGQVPNQNYDENYEQAYRQYGGGQPVHGYDQGGYRQLSASLILDDGSDRHHQLTAGSTVVGRGQDAQFRLPDTGVSRRHLEITWDGQTAVLADLGSTNGTTVNGTPVQTWQLADGDVVRVGQSQLVFRTQG
jgi:FhaA, N-terminal domain/FHA domain